MEYSIEAIMAKFSDWLAEASAHPYIAEPTAMGLATADRHGIPSLRIVLLKAHDTRGFGFYTNNESRKGQELLENPNVALCFHWMPLGRQFRVEGKAERLHAAESDAYFSTRSRESRIGAWASEQSRSLASREELLTRYSAIERRFEGMEVPRPPHWSGWRVVPHVMEFWQEGTFRLHEREVYRRQGEVWLREALFP